MIFKVMADGARVGGLLAYMLKGTNASVELDPADEPHLGEDEERELGTVEYRNLASDNRRDAAREMEIVARRSERCKKPFLHYAIAWPPNEKPSEERMVEAMDRTLAKMGLQQHQAVYAVHREKDHLHIHAAINRVIEGRAWSRFKSFNRLAEASLEVEKEMGFLPREQFAKHIADREVKPTAKQQRIYERTGVEPDLRFAERAHEA